MPRQIRHVAIHQITRDGHDISAQCVYLGYDALQKGMLDGRPHMYVTDLRQHKTLQRNWQARNRHINPYDCRGAARI